VILNLGSKVSHVRHACKHEPCNDKYVFEHTHRDNNILAHLMIKESRDDVFAIYTDFVA
jgi:hypothetical protein